MEHLLGKGSYTIPEAARIVRANARAVRRWSLGYSYQSRDEGIRTLPPLLLTSVLEIDSEPVLSFKQLIELKFISLFRQYEITIPVIRSAAEFACHLLENNNPFAAYGLMTDGKRIFMDMSPDSVEDVDRERVVHDLGVGQTVMADIAERYFQKIDYDLLDAIRFWPLGKNRRVVIDPARHFGMPIDPKSGVPTNILYRMRVGGEEETAVADWYGVDSEAVRDAVEYEIELKQKPQRRLLLAA